MPVEAESSDSLGQLPGAGFDSSAPRPGEGLDNCEETELAGSDSSDLTPIAGLAASAPQEPVGRACKPVAVALGPVGEGQDLALLAYRSASVQRLGCPHRKSGAVPRPAEPVFLLREPLSLPRSAEH